jgi:hypothetical protein
MTWNAAVIITAHNAAGTIAAPLRALAHQALAADSRLRVVVVDDRSTDETVRQAQAHLPAGGRLLRVMELPRHGMSARQSALDVAARDATSAAPPADALLVLDADAEPPQEWVEGMRLALGAADLVSWPLSYDPADGSWRARVLAMLQSADVAFYLMTCRGLAACGLGAGICFGAAGWRRALYDGIGGFRALGFTLIEDLAFARAAHARGARLAFPAGESVRVRGVPTWDALVERALRVSRAGGASALSLSLGVGVATLPLMAVVVLMGMASPWWLAARWLAGVLFVVAGLRRGRALRAWPAAFIYEVAAVVTAMFVAARSRRAEGVVWGGARYDAGQATPVTQADGR